MKRKILSLILVFAMTVSLLTVGTGAVEPTYGDTAGHWAESSIERWSAYGIIQGSNGQFDPNGQLTCAQLATILAKLLKLPAAKDAGFTDNTADAWYYDAINRCAAAGILNGNGDGTVTPEAPITRERAIVMLARALGIEPIRKPDLTKYTDAAQVSAYAQGYVAALIEAGIVGGVTADELAPQDNINRASTVTILDRAIGTYADKAGATVKADGKGLVLVVAENVKITGAPEGTKIVVADGATGLTVNGKSVSDDQTYIVPKTTTSSGSSSSGGSSTPSHTHSYDATTHKCSCGEVDPAYAVASVSSKNYLTLSEAITAAQSGNKTVTLAASKTTTETIQQILDGQHGSIDGLTIELPSGTYGALELGRATKYAGSNTKYYLGRNGINTEKTLDEIKAWSDSNEWGSAVYVRSMSNVTLKAADGASVKIAGVNASSGHKHVPEGGTPIYDYVLDKETTVGSSHYLVNKLSNITFDGLTFTAGVDINTSNEETVINGFTFKNCTFNINNTADGNQAIRYYNENNNGKVSNLVVDNCKFNNCFQGVYTHHVKNVIVTNSEFDTTGHNAIAIQDHSGACNHGKVIITGNTFKNIGDRIIRFGNVGADTSITITYNTATNSGDESDEVIKITSLAQGATCDIHDNSWGDGKKVNIPDSRVEMQAQIGEAQYATLAAALAAAKDGDTVKLLGNISTDEGIGVAKKITLDMAGHTITSSVKQVFTVTGSGDLTITGNGTISGPAGEAAKALDGKAVLMVSGESAKLTVLNGTITAGGVNDCGMYGIYVADSGNVILGDADTKTGPTITTWFAAVGENNTTSPANITIYGGEYTAQAAPDESDSWAYFCAPVYASASGDINIYGGTFNGYYGISSRYVNVGQNLNISGGTFKGSNSALFVDTKSGVECSETRTIAITGGTFSSDPTAYVAEGYITLVNGNGTFTVSNTNEIPVTNTTAQDYLDGKYGAVNGKTLMLAAGEYGTLYFRQSVESETFASGATGGDANNVSGEKVTYAYHPGRTDVTYMRTLKDMTIVGCDGATVDGIEFMDGSYKYAEDTAGVLSGNTIYSEENVVTNHGQDTDWNNRLISFFTINNLTFKNITFTGSKIALNMGYHSNDPGLEGFTYRYTVDGLNFVGCKMTMPDDHSSGDIMLLQIARDISQTTRYKNVSVKNCKISADRVLRVDGIENLTISGNTFTNIKDRALNFSQGGTLQTVTGDVVISKNTSTGNSERFVRIGDASGMNLTITDNTISDYKGTDNDYIKVTGGPLSYTISGNTATAADTSKTLTINVNGQTVNQA